MSKKGTLRLLLFLGILTGANGASAQILPLREAIETALANYGTIKAKNNLLKSSQSIVNHSHKEYLPNFNLSLQQDYGTVNGQNGPLYGLGLSVASSGLPLPSQNWNSAFGSLYLTNVNWDFFAFGRARERIKVAQTAVARDESDLEQELFQHKIRVAGAYLNLIAAQRLTHSWEKNLERATSLRTVVITRAKNGLIPGVDSSLANAEVSNARIAVTRARDFEQEQSNRLSTLMGIGDKAFQLDTSFVTKIPDAITPAKTAVGHPLLNYYTNRVHVSDQQARYFQTLSYPTLSLFGVFQGRGSGFSSNYAVDQSAYNHSYLDGINPVRANYLLGIGMVWNMTSVLRVREQVRSQKYISAALQNEYDLLSQQLSNQSALAEKKIKNALDNYNEVPTQMKAASDAYLQKSVLYKNGLSNIVDITQALYALNRAETDRDIAYSNVWQALLLKAAAEGDFGLFMNL
ncbi:hypothetical protein DYBT9275_01918 [Dyadobacter sp. CECT 9275]|uniref:Outer membrane protein TolC n=1 Tax=Dyadobacter helix TaxID=2822344 RepID=A0A916JBJ9_9BACT|nr:TolC family protein [Dyadobacter sp. CECT 9275]CAG4998065.1 hypothetical protein DYBT9275_01918 [Dyadobacter sp. CECT 9275]